MTLAGKPLATMTDVTLLYLVLVVVAILGAVRVMHFFRARAVEHNRVREQRHISVHFRWPLGRVQKSASHLYRLPDRTESIPDDYIGRTRDTDSWMDGSSWGVVPLVLLVYGHRAD